MKKALQITAITIWSLFALAGLFLVGGYFAMQWGLTNVPGAISFDSQYLVSPEEVTASANSALQNDNPLPGPRDFIEENSKVAFFCSLSVLSAHYPDTAKNIFTAYENTHNLEVARRQVTLLNSYVNEKTRSALHACEEKRDPSRALGTADESGTQTPIPWTQTAEWKTFAKGMVKERDVVDRVANETGVSSRLIVSLVVPEQMRLYNSNRQAFKNYFAPLGILGTETMFSLGVTGVKEQTASAIETHLDNSSSPFYPGAGYKNLISYKPGAKKSTVRIERLSDTKNHYYSYLYAALFIKEIEAQWERAGYDIGDRPGILATLWNIGFGNSNPNSDPEIGGTEIDMGGKKYTFGSIAYEFYYSGTLLKAFPYK